jgi:hypothetical protein
VCTLLYVGADLPLPVEEWVPPGREISVFEATREPDVVALFSKPHVYSIGTRLTGDGCGFQGDHKEARRAREELATFLERALELASPMELFVAWHDFGNSGVRPSRFDWIGPTSAPGSQSSNPMISFWSSGKIDRPALVGVTMPEEDEGIGFQAYFKQCGKLK